MAREEKFYVDADALRDLLSAIPPSFYWSGNNGGGYYTGTNSIDAAIDAKINAALSEMSNTMITYHQSLIANFSRAIEEAKKPYTQCMLCDSNGQKTIDEKENGEG